MVGLYLEPVTSTNYDLGTHCARRDGMPITRWWLGSRDLGDVYELTSAQLREGVSFSRPGERWCHGVFRSAIRWRFDWMERI